MKEFFMKYLHLSSNCLIKVVQDENQYRAIRFELLQAPTDLEQQILSRIASIKDAQQATALKKKKKNRIEVSPYIIIMNSDFLLQEGIYIDYGRISSIIRH